jgi:ADP-heptose:LPS heptosyltransferase
MKRLPPDLTPRRVAVLRPRGLGDVVLSTAVLQAIRLAWPEAAIDYLAEKPSRALLETDPRLDRIFLLGSGERSGDIRFGGAIAAIRWLRDGRPDVVFDLFSNPRTAFVTGCSGAPWRVGLDRSVRRIAYNVRVPRFRGGPEVDHRFAGDVLVDFVRDAGLVWTGDATANAPVTETDREFARDALAQAGYPAGARFGAVLPGGSWESKRWTVAGFAAAARALAGHFGEPTLVIWGPPEQDDARGIADAAGPAARLAPPSTLRQMGALLGTPALLVATDCLGRHLALVQGTPTVGVFGSTDPRHWTPHGGPHGTVHAPALGHASLSTLPPGPVLAEIARQLDRGPGAT